VFGRFSPVGIKTLLGFLNVFGMIDLTKELANTATNAVDNTVPKSLDDLKPDPKEQIPHSIITVGDESYIVYVSYG
jgi:hypothetical protein